MSGSRRALARVNVAAIERNVERLRSHLEPSTQLCAVVKADGYGHGAEQAARAALAGGARWLAVAGSLEARRLREEGIGEVPLLVMGALTGPELGEALAAGADVVVWRERDVAEVAEAGGGRVHVKLDSGMGRLGTRDPLEADRVVAAAATTEGVRLAGVMTHFATADDEGDGGYFDRQLELFERWASQVKRAHPEVVVHAANSAATLREPRSHFDMVRCGIAVYGMDPFGVDPLERGLEPALELCSYVAEVKRCRAGESAGYGRRFIATSDTQLGVLPIGYGDGWRRELSGGCEVLIGGARRPQVGTISMDNLTVELGPEPGAGGLLGAEAVLIGAQGQERITAEEIARRLGTINYEITCGLTARVPRCHHRDGARPQGAAGGAGAGRRARHMSGALEAVRAALGGRRAWLVGGAVRDRALGREAVEDLDVVVDGDPGEASAAIAAALRRAGQRPARFELSEEWGAWRVVAGSGGWQVDIEPLRGGALEQDLALRDFTVNAVAEPLAGGAPIDPLGGLRDLAQRRLRLASPEAFRQDPLRILRLARIAIELDLEAEPAAVRAAQAGAQALERVSAERVFFELRRIVDAAQAVRGIEMLSELGATAIVLPALGAARGVEQNRYHHLDVYGHTLEVLARVIELQEGRDSEGWLDSLDAANREAVAAILREPLADGLTRGGALRWGALLHDLAKPATREVRPSDGHITFLGHDHLGAEMARSLLGGLRASERLRGHVAGLVRHHLRLGFLVHEPQPLDRRTLYSYLRACGEVAVDVTLLSVGDRLATRGERARSSIDAHLAVASQVLVEALRWRAEGPPVPLVRGDELAAALGLAPGPRLGELLEELAEAQYTGEVSTREEAIDRARRLEASQ